MAESRNIQLLDAKESGETLRDLILGSDEISFAVAWGGQHSLSKLLRKQEEKIHRGIIGTHFYQTAPELLWSFQGRSSVRVDVTSNEGVFHPKCYLFTEGNEAKALIGSSNFTEGGLCKNREANILVQGACDDAIFQNVRALIDEAWGKAEHITQQLIEEYSVRYQRDQRVRSFLKRATSPAAISQTNGGMLEGISLRWDDFVSRAKNSQHHNFQQRLDLLHKAQEIFASQREFAMLSERERCAIAGLKVGEDPDDSLADYGWGMFGFMAAAAKFGSLVRDNTEEISRALEEIPERDHVEERNYNEFAKRFKSAFGEDGGGNVATGTRLLAMKRPDSFVCVSRANRRGLADAFGFARTTLSLGNYWAKVIESMRVSNWYTSDRPQDADGRRIWDVRAAMLDAIYYSG